MRKPFLAPVLSLHSSVASSTPSPNATTHDPPTFACSKNWLFDLNFPALLIIKGRVKWGPWNPAWSAYGKTRIMYDLA